MTAPGLDSLATFAWKGAALLLGCWIVLRLFARGRAASRAHVLELAFAGLVLLPVGELLLPTWRVELPFRLPTEAALAAPPRSGPVPPRAPTLVIATDEGSTAVTSTAAAPTRAPRRELEPAHAVLALWAAGALLILARLARGRHLSRALLRAAPPVDAATTQLVDTLRRHLGVSRRVRVVESAASAVPGTFGVWPPVIVLPRASRGWDRDRLRAVLLHELAHVARLDAARQVLTRLALALHWFNPMAWAAQRRWKLERERACDDQVLAHGVRATDYATHLVEIAAGGTSPRGALAMAEPSLLETRVVSLLESDPSPSTVTWRSKMLRTLSFVALVAPLSALALAPQDPPRTPPAEPTSAPRPEEVSAPEAVANFLRHRRDAALEERFDPYVAEESRPESAGIDLEGILELKNRGVTAEWLRAMRGVIADPSVEVLVRLHDHGVSPEYVAAVLATGRDDVDVGDLVALFENGVDPELGRTLPELGHEGFSVDEQLVLHAHGISPSFHLRMVEALGQQPSVEELLLLKAHAIEPDVAREFSHVYRVSVEEMAHAVAQGVTVEYSRAMKAAMPRLGLDDVIELRVHGVEPELVEAAVGVGARARRDGGR